MWCTGNEERYIEMYWAKRKVHWEVRMTTSVGQILNAGITTDLGRRGYLFIAAHSLNFAQLSAALHIHIGMFLGGTRN